MQFYLLCSDTYADCISLTRHAIQHHLVVDTHIHVQEHTYWTALVFYLEHAAHAFQLLSPYLSLNSHSFPNNTFAVLQLSKPEPLQHPPLPVDTFVSLEVGGGEVTLVLAATHCNEQPVLLLALKGIPNSCFCMLSMCCIKNIFGSKLSALLLLHLLA